MAQQFSFYRYVFMYLYGVWPKSCNTVCPRPESCDAPRALMSVAPNLCCDETKNRGTYTRVTKRTFKRRVNSTKQLLNAGRGHQAPRKATHCLQKEVAKNIKDKKKRQKR